MTTYTIKQGAVNAKPNKTALRFVRSGAAWRVRFKLDTNNPTTGVFVEGPSLAPTPVPPTHIKLLGLYWSGWMVWQRMREAWRKADSEWLPVSWLFAWGGKVSVFEARVVRFAYNLSRALRQYLAWTHGNSARVIAKWETRKVKGKDALDKMEWEFGQRGVSLSTHYYLQGRGAVTTGSPVAGREICWLPEDADNPGWTVWGEVMIAHDGHGLSVQADGFEHQYVVAPAPWFFGLCKPHAANGPSSPHAPCDLTFEMERI